MIIYGKGQIEKQFEIKLATTSSGLQIIIFTIKPDS